MKLTIDIRSAAIGLVVGIIAMLVIGAGTNPPGNEGRYQVVIGANPPILVEVDTVTGQMWMGNGMANQLRSDGNIFEPKLK